MADGFELADEIEALQDVQNYIIPNEHDIHSQNPAHILEGQLFLFETPLDSR
jgi:condensin complex subunit 1